MDIDGEAIYDESGYSVAMASNITRIAIEAYLIDRSDINAGHVWLYEGFGIPIPTLSQWGIIVLALILMIFCVLTIKEEQRI